MSIISALLTAVEHVYRCNSRDLRLLITNEVQRARRCAVKMDLNKNALSAISAMSPFPGSVEL
jgi:hypothetical protein